MGCDEVILLDTHVAVWVVTEDTSLGKRSRSMASAALARGELFVSAISFWEMALLIAKGRLKASRSPTEQRAMILDAGIVELPVTGDIAVRAAGLASLHPDPADRFIAATAIVHGAALMTADAELLRWPHAVQRHDASK